MFEKWLKATLNKQAQQIDNESEEIWMKISQRLDQEALDRQAASRKRVWFRAAAVAIVCFMLTGLTISFVPQVKAFTEGIWNKIMIYYEVVFDGESFSMQELETPREGLSRTHYLDRYETLEEAIAVTGVEMVLPTISPDYSKKTIYGDTESFKNTIDISYEADDDVTWRVSATTSPHITLDLYEVDRITIGETVVHHGKTYALRFDEEDQYKREFVGTFDRLRWFDQDKGVIYTIGGQISLQDMLEMAESIILSSENEDIESEEP